MKANFPRLAHQPARITFLIALFLAASGCDHYTVDINDQRVYTPPSLFNDFEVVDPNLKRCVQQTIADHRVKSAAQLTRLHCTHAGIYSLEGLEIFKNLSHLNLSTNDISSIAPLAYLEKLEHIKLNNNAITSLSPASGWQSLKYLDVRGNPSLNCQETQLLANINKAKRLLPHHCLN